MYERNGTILARSILGDSLAYNEIENRAHSHLSGSSQSSLQQLITPATEDIKSPKRKLIKPPPKPVPVVEKKPVGNLNENPGEYMRTLRDLQEKMTLSRTKTFERSATLLKFLPIYEQTSLNREGAILSNWQERQKEWDKIQTDISQRVNAPKVILSFILLYNL